MIPSNKSGVFNYFNLQPFQSSTISIFDRYFCIQSNHKSFLMAHNSRFVLWKASAVSIAVCVLIHGFVHLDHIYSTAPLCNSRTISSWVWQSKCFSTVAFLSNGGLLLSDGILHHRSEDTEFSSTWSTLTIILIAGISGLLEILLEWGGYCEDPF
eukprot:gene12633-26604_t